MVIFSIFSWAVVPIIYCLINRSGKHFVPVNNIQSDNRMDVLCVPLYVPLFVPLYVPLYVDCDVYDIHAESSL